MDRAPIARPGTPPREHERLRVLVVARQPVARAGLRALVEEQPDFEVADAAQGLADLPQYPDAVPPQVALALGGTDGPEALADLAQALSGPGIPLVALADLSSPTEVLTAIRGGVRGLLPPDAGADDVAAALRAVRQGLLVLDPPLVRLWIAASPAADAGPLLDEPLTEREREVLDLMALGLPNKLIGSRLHISEHTVKFHVGSILAKLGASSRTEAVTRAVRRGLVAL